jgi:SSS family solute:Na+ symporter/sodium/pantothenate symporter
MPELAAGSLLWADAGAAEARSPYIVAAFVLYMVGVFALGALAHHLLKRGSFLKQYFLGDRKLNAWVLSLTYVATSVSAGTFVGFPSFIYQNGWVVALWISGYMIAGLTTKGVLAKRLNQVSRLSGCITVPDVLRDRYQSPALGVVAGLLILLFLVFNLVAQFKAGGVILQQACGGVRGSPVYERARSAVAETLASTSAWDPEHATRHSGTLYDDGYPDYVLGILIFAITVVAYTTYGGFWAVTWTDVLQGLIMVAGALLLMFLALDQVGGLGNASRQMMQKHETDLLTGPGPHNFLPIGVAVSMFTLWSIGAAAQPAPMVRLMACRDTPTLRRSLFLISVYYGLIYMPLVITFICARAHPEVGDRYLSEPDRIMPVMALAVTKSWPFLGGLILAAPYAAAMSSVSGALLVMSSSLVRDIYQRNLNPSASPRAIRWITYGSTAAIGIVVTLASLRPPRFLQHVIIFTGSGFACAFLAPIVLGLYWRRVTRAGALVSIAGGVSTLGVLYALGWMGIGKAGKEGTSFSAFAPLYLFNLDPLIYGMAVAFLLGVVVSLCTSPLPPTHVDRYFVADNPAA